MRNFRFHKLAAVVVLIAFAAWVATGEFSSVGSASDEQAAKTDNAAKPAAQKAGEQEKAPLRKVGVVEPPRSEHARAIRVSGLTEADKRAVLATRVGGVIEKLPVKQGQRKIGRVHV